MTKQVAVPPRGYISIPEAAARLGIHRQVVYNLVYSRTLASTRRNGRIWVSAAAVQERLANRHRLRSDCISVGEVAEFFGVHTRTVLAWHHQGQLVATKVTNRLCFALDDVVTFVPPYLEVGQGRVPVHEASRTLRGVYYAPPNDG